jgi:hypothetical protein
MFLSGPKALRNRCNYGLTGRGARKKIPDEPGRRDPEIESRVQSEGRDDLDFDEDVNEGEEREHGLREVAGDGEEDGGQSEGLIEDPAKRSDEKGDEQERAAVLEPIP